MVSADRNTVISMARSLAAQKGKSISALYSVVKGWCQINGPVRSLTARQVAEKICQKWGGEVDDDYVREVDICLNLLVLDNLIEPDYEAHYLIGT